MSYKQKARGQQEIIFDIRSEYKRLDSPKKYEKDAGYKMNAKTKKMLSYDKFDSI